MRIYIVYKDHWVKEEVSSLERKCIKYRVIAIEINILSRRFDNTACKVNAILWPLRVYVACPPHAQVPLCVELDTYRLSCPSSSEYKLFGCWGLYIVEGILSSTLQFMAIYTCFPNNPQVFPNNVFSLIDVGTAPGIHSRPTTHISTRSVFIIDTFNTLIIRILSHKTHQVRYMFKKYTTIVLILTIIRQTI